MNEGNAPACFTCASKGAFSVVPARASVGPSGVLAAEVVWCPHPGCKVSETLVIKVRLQHAVSMISVSMI